MARQWTCRGCRTINPRIKQRCECGRKRPPARRPAHREVLDALPYEDWVARFGERCGICGAKPSGKRRLDRDHDHRTGQPRGLLCHICNRSLGNRDVAWLWQAAGYLQAAQRRLELRLDDP